MIDFYEIVGLVAAIITTAAFLPQVFKTYKTKDTSGLSLSMYISFLFGVVLWLIYGFHLKSFPMILAPASKPKRKPPKATIKLIKIV